MVLFEEAEVNSSILEESFKMGQVHQVLNMGKSLYFLFWADVYYFVVMKKGNFLVQHFVWFLGATICFYLPQVNHSGSCRALSSIHANGENYLSQQKRIRIPMEEEMLSVISNGETNVNSEISDSISSTPFRASKRARHGTHVSAKFKGVVLQPNGHWGAQIYANHQRIWLGTFKTENEAAMAYDSAIIKLRSSDCHRNFPWTNITIKEPKFQRLYSTEAIINMIRGGTYQLKFAEFVRTCSQSVETEVVVNLEKARSNGGLSCKRMFLKELTPSDVGKLNRLVIPKQFAIKFFPPISENGEGNVLSGKLHDVQLVFYDKSMKLWKFRYCYWNSSQSFVFTRGWNRFVKENQLKAKDVLMFYSCERKEKVKEGQTFWMIDVYKGRSSGGEVEMANECVRGVQVDLQLRLGQYIVYDGDDKNAEEKGLMGVKPTQDTETKGFKLFGVQII